MSDETTGTESVDLPEEIKVTPEMVEAGMAVLYEHAISDASETEIRKALVEAFTLMSLMHSGLRTSNAQLEHTNL